MQDHYYKLQPDDSNHYECQGVSLHYEKIDVEGNKTSPETGTVLLHFGSCGAGTVSHELLHATLWAYKHRKGKKQYPIIIKDMDEEEVILRNHTEAVRQFYIWYWKVRGYFYPLKKK